MSAPKRLWVIGRFPSCDIRVDDDYASGEHCLVRRLDDGRLVVSDLGSTNGTYLVSEAGAMAKVVAPTLWEPGVSLRVGRSEIKQPRLTLKR